jgi:hypothetical protein
MADVNVKKFNRFRLSGRTGGFLARFGADRIIRRLGGHDPHRHFSDMRPRGLCYDSLWSAIRDTPVARGMYG